MHNHRETALAAVVYLVIKAKIPFTQKLQFSASEFLQNPGGVMLLTAHLNLNRLLIREIAQQGKRINIVTNMPTAEHYVGYDIPHAVIPPDAQSLWQISKKIRAGEVVYLTVEMRKPNKNCQPLLIGDEPFYISATPFAFAERAQIPIYFVAPHLDNEGQPLFIIRQPSSQKSAIAFSEFCQFISSEYALR